MEGKSEVLLYETANRGIEIQVRLENDTLWLSQKQIAALFGTEIPAIDKRINNIVDDGELSADTTISKMEIVQTEGQRQVRRQINSINNASSDSSSPERSA